MRIIDFFENTNIIYIHSIEINFNQKIIIINFIANPEKQDKIDIKLIFYNFKSFLDNIDELDYDPDCLDSLIDIQEIHINQFIKYIITTEQREIEIYTAYLASIEDLN